MKTLHKNCRIEFIKKFQNVRKIVHINRNNNKLELSLIWFGDYRFKDGSKDKNVPIIRTKYFDVNNLPPLIKRRINDVNLKPGYLFNGHIYEKVADIKKSDRPLNKTYLYKLLDRAIHNPMFENNRLGKYRITTQHGINVAKFIIYKKIDHLATIDITDNYIRLQLNKASKREKQIFIHFFETVYTGKTIEILEL